MSVLAQLTLRLVTKCLTPDQALAANEKLLKSLVTHSQERTPDDYLNRTIMSAFLLRILQKGGFFGRRTTEGVDPVGKELAIGVQMLELLQALQFNAHEVYETVAGEDHPINGSKMNYIGGDRVGFLGLGRSTFYKHFIFLQALEYTNRLLSAITDVFLLWPDTLMVTALC